MSTKAMTVTVNCDASFNAKAQVGAYAFWIVSNKGRICHSGPIKGTVTNSTEAEMKCICNALHVVCKKIPEVSRVIVNTDSMNAIHLFSGHKNMIRKYHLDGESYKSANKEFKRLRDKLINVKVEFRHVRAHQGNVNARSFVNEWCDTAAKAEMFKLVGHKKKHANLE